MSRIERGPEPGPTGPEIGRRIERGPESGRGSSREDTSAEEFVAGLQKIAAAKPESLLHDFSQAAYDLTGNTDLPRSLRGMFWMGRHYHRTSAVGSLKAMDDPYEREQAEIEETPSAIIVTPQTEEAPQQTQPGILVGLVGAQRSDEGVISLQGVAAMGEKGDQGLVAVSVALDGKITLHQSYHDPEQPKPKTDTDRYTHIIKTYDPQIHG